MLVVSAGAAATRQEALRVLRPSSVVLRRTRRVLVVRVKSTDHFRSGDGGGDGGGDSGGDGGGGDGDDGGGYGDGGDGGYGDGGGGDGDDGDGGGRMVSGCRSRRRRRRWH